MGRRKACFNRAMSGSFNFSNDKLGRFLDCLGSEAPSPGGGAAAALAAATGAALVEMVARINSKKRFSSNLLKIRKIRSELLRLASKDAAVFKSCASDFKKGKNSSAYQSALKRCVMPPLEICERCVRTLEMGIREISRTSRWLAGDLAEAGILLEAAFRSAKLNVEVNLKGMSDAVHAGRVRKRLHALESRVRSLTGKIRKILR